MPCYKLPKFVNDGVIWLLQEYVLRIEEWWTREFYLGHRRRLHWGTDAGRLSWGDGLDSAHGRGSIPGTVNYAVVMLESVILLNYPDFTFQGWHTALLVIFICLMQAMMNMYTFWTIPWIELVSVVLHVALFVLLYVVLATLGTRHSGDFIFME